MEVIFSIYKIFRNFLWYTFLNINKIFFIINDMPIEFIN